MGLVGLSEPGFMRMSEPGFGGIGKIYRMSITKGGISLSSNHGIRAPPEIILKYWLKIPERKMKIYHFLLSLWV